MSIALVQSVQSSSGSGNLTGNGTNVGTTGHFSLSTTSGNFLIALLYVRGTITSGSFGNVSYTIATSGLTWTNSAVIASWQNGANFGIVTLFYKQNAASVLSSTSTSFTAVQTSGGVDNIAIVVEGSLFEFSGVLQSGTVIENSTSRVNQAASVPTCGNRTLALSDLLISAYSGDSGVISPGPGYSSGPAVAAVQYGASQYILNSGAGTFATAFSGSAQAHWGALFFAFKPIPAPAAVGVTFGSLFGF